MWYVGKCMRAPITVLPWQQVYSMTGANYSWTRHFFPTCCLREESKVQTCQADSVSALTLYIRLIHVRQLTHFDMKCCEVVSQPSDLHHSVPRERPEHETVTRQANRDNCGTYNTTLGLGLNIELQSSVAWGGRTRGNSEEEKESKNNLRQK